VNAQDVRIHVDPVAAAAIGMPRPILHGLCAMAMATLPLASAAGAHPADLVSLEGRFAAPVFPGDVLDVRSWTDGAFEVASGEQMVISGGKAMFN
jgi:acyl dehydratase